MYGQTSSAYGHLVHAYRSLLKKMRLRNAVTVVSLAGLACAPAAGILSVASLLSAGSALAHEGDDEPAIQVGGGSDPLAVLPVDPSGVFVGDVGNPLASDTRLGMARGLIIYARDLSSTQDMYTAPSGGRYGTQSRYQQLLMTAADQRQWLALNSGGKMDMQFTILDSGALGYASGTTPWASPSDIIDTVLAANGLTRSQFDYIAVNADDVGNSIYFVPTPGTAGVGSIGGGSGTQQYWYESDADHHELGHNLGFGHTNSYLTDSSLNSLYNYDGTDRGK